MFRFLMALLLALLPALVLAQTFPEYQRITVNDYAGLLDETAETDIHTRLSDLRQSTGIEMSVLTIRTQADYMPEQTVEEFATALFNHWGIGDAKRNDGILVLIIRDDRAMRIELGAGFGRDWDRAAATVIDRSFLPAFSDGRYQDGIRVGVADVIDTIAIPFQGGEAAPSKGFEIGWIFLAAVVGMFLLGVRRTFGDLLVRVKTCPNCGRRGLARRRKTVRKPTRSATGSGRATTRCQYCDYRDTSIYTIGRLSSPSRSSSFGGGSSGGGGATGRW